jgi:hypothetical protein
MTNTTIGHYPFFQSFFQFIIGHRDTSTPHWANWVKLMISQARAGFAPLAGNGVQPGGRTWWFPAGLLNRLPHAV